MAGEMWHKMADSKLVAEAQEGLRGQGAVVEMMRRLKNSNNYLTYVNLLLAAAAVMVALAQFWKR